jgi:hypothetical protein
MKNIWHVAGFVLYVLLMIGLVGLSLVMLLVGASK